MSDRCVEELREFGAVLTVSETIKEIIHALHSDEKPLHKVVYDVPSGQFGFVFDDGRFKHLLQQGQEPSEEVKKLKILLDETLGQMKMLERESGAAVARAAASQKSAMKSDAETKEVLKKLRAKEKELAAGKKAEAALQKQLEEQTRLRRRAEAEAAESKAQLTRATQAKADVKESGEEAKAELRLKLANAMQKLEEMRKRVDISENNYRGMSKEVVVEKDLRFAAEQRAGDLNVICEAAQQQLQSLREVVEVQMMQQQDVEGAKAVEDVVTHVAATQTEAYVGDSSTPTESGGNLELEGQVPALKSEVASATQTEPYVVESATQAEPAPETALTVAERNRLEAEVQRLQVGLQAEEAYVRSVYRQDQHTYYDRGYEDGKAKRPRNNDWFCKMCNTWVSYTSNECYICHAPRRSVSHTTRGRGNYKPRGRGK